MDALVCSAAVLQAAARDALVWGLPAKSRHCLRHASRPDLNCARCRFRNLGVDARLVLGYKVVAVRDAYLFRA